MSSARGLQVVIVTSAKEDDHGRSLLDALGMPFQDNIKYYLIKFKINLRI